MIENHLRNGVALNLDNDTNIVLGFIADVANANDHLLLDELHHVLEHLGLIDAIRNFRDDDSLAPVGRLLNLGNAAHGELPTPLTIHRIDAVDAANLRASREVGALHKLHEIVNRAVLAVLDIIIDSIAKFTEIMRRNVRGHTDGDTGRAVQKKIRKLGGKDSGLFESFIEVRSHIHGVLVEIAKKLLGDLLHTHFGITHGSCAIAID